LRTWALPGLVGAVVLTIVALGAFGGGSAVDAAGSATSPRPVLGDAAAPVVIREYADFQCPSCGAFARLIEPQIRAAYIDTGKVRLEWHDFAWIGPESRDAANAARCAGDQGRFWEFHDLLYASQAGENQGAFAKDRLKAFGADLGLDAVAFDACVDGDTHRGAIEADLADVRASGFNATPTFLVGEQRIVGAQPFEVFRAAIDAQLASE
jgi:protein-disulfide isomerase